PLSSPRQCFLKMPASWPTSDTEVSQLPRWPTASFTVSSANAAVAVPSSVSAASAQLSLFFIIVSSPSFFASVGRLALAAQVTSLRGFLPDLLRPRPPLFFTAQGEHLGC